MPLHPPAPQTIMMIAIVAFVLAIRLRRMRRERRLRLEWLWVWPAFVLGIAGTVFVLSPPPPLGWAAGVAAAGVGAVLGWQRARLVRVEIDPESHALSQRESPWAVLLIVAIILLRQVLRVYGGAEAAALHLNPLVIGDVLIAFAAGLFVAQRLVLWRRARALLDEARRAVS